MVSDTDVIQMAIARKIYPLYEAQYGQDYGATIAAAVANKLFSKVSPMHRKEELELADHLATELLKTDQEIRYASLMSCRARLLFEAEMNTKEQWQVWDTIQWMASVCNLAQDEANPALIKNLAITLHKKYLEKTRFSKKMNIIEIIHLFMESITKKGYTIIIQDINKIGMGKEPDSMIGFHPFIPKYDKIQRFSYITDNNEHILIGIFGIDNNILEIDMGIFPESHKLSFFSPGNKLYNIINELFARSYGEGYSIKYGKKDNTYENDEVEISLVYDRPCKTDLITINFKNKKYHRKLF